MAAQQSIQYSCKLGLVLMLILAMFAISSIQSTAINIFKHRYPFYGGYGYGGYPYFGGYGGISLGGYGYGR